MNSFIEILNLWGQAASQFAWPMLWQSSLLIAVVLALDFALRRKVRAAVRYGLWLIVLVKLLLPPSLALPTGLAWWLRPPVVPEVPVASEAAGLPMIVTVRAEPFQLPPPSSYSSSPVVFEPPVSRTPISGGALALLAWGVVSGGLLVWFTLRWQFVARRASQATSLPKSGDQHSLAELFDAARRAAGVRGKVSLRVVNRSISPAVCGLFRPVILLPQSLVEQLPPAQLRAVLLHELIHLRRRDVWVNCLQALLQIFYWWHPLLWFANARIRRLREEAVDDSVMIVLADEADAYAPTLLEVAKLAFHRPLTALGLVGILESRRGLRQRIERLMNFKTPGRAGLSIVSLLGIATFTALAVPMGEAPPKPAAPVKANQSASAASASRPDSNSAPVSLVQSGAYRSHDPETGTTVQADSMNYDGQTGTMRLDGNVRITTTNGKVTADSATFMSPSPATNALRTDAARQGRQAIITKLSEIRIDRVAYDHTPLSEVIINLTREVRKLDSTAPRINFSIRFSPEFEWDINSVPVTINPPLSNARLIDVLDAIVKGVDKPIKYTIEDYAVIFSAKGPETARLEGRSFQVDPLIFNQALTDVGGLDPSLLSRATSGAGGREQPGGTMTIPRALVSGGAVETANAGDGGMKFVTRTNAITEIQTAVMKFFAAVGVDLSPQTGKNVFYSDSRGTLTVRATAQDLDIIEAAIMTLSLGPVSGAQLNPVPSGQTNAFEEAVIRFEPNPAAPQSTTNLYQRAFRVDPNAFYSGLADAGALPREVLDTTAFSRGGPLPAYLTRTNWSRKVVDAVKAFFNKQGIDLEPPKNVFFNDRHGTLLVRATEQELDLIEAGIRTLNRMSPQVNIEVKFVEMGPSPMMIQGNIPIGNGAVGLDRIPDVPLIETQRAPGATAPGTVPPSAGLVFGILTAPQYRVVLEAMKQMTNVDILSEGQVRTRSGRQTQVQVGGSNATNIHQMPLVPGSNMPLLGHTVDVIPHVGADGYTVDLTAVTSLLEFAGNTEGAVPHPEFRARQVTSRVVLWDGQTLVLSIPSEKVVRTTGGPPLLGELPFVGRLFRDRPMKTLLIFITPTIVDPAGNRVPRDETRPQNSLPPQPR